jgi:hypothetical protein
VGDGKREAGEGYLMVDTFMDELNIQNDMMFLHRLFPPQSAVPDPHFQHSRSPLRERRWMRCTVYGTSLVI